jgi:hypothetical protein
LLKIPVTISNSVTKLALLAAALLSLAACVAGCGSSSGDSGPARPATYKITINNGWSKVADEKEVDGFLESAWHDPVGPTYAVNTRLSSETGPPMYNAQLARIQTSKMPGYRERWMKREKVGGRPVVVWAFDVANEESRVEYFFEECGTLFVTRGAMGTIGFEAFARDWHEYTRSIEPDCEE